MKKNIWIVVLLALLAAMAVAVVRQNRQIAGMKEQLAFAAAEKARTPKVPPVPAPKRVAAEPLPEAKPIEPVTAPTSVPTSAPPPDAHAGTSTGTASNFFSGLAGMMKNPQMKEMVRAQQKMMIDQMYGSLSKYMNLSADQLDALKNLLLERQMAMVDAGLSAMGGPEADRKQAAEDTMAIKADYDQKIKDLLGPQDYQVFQDYDKTVAERVQMQMFKNSLPTDAALTDQQEYDLISAMYEERKAMPVSSPLNNQTSDPSQLTEEKIDQALKTLEQLQQRYTNRAAAILSPQQFQQFQQFLSQQQAMQTMSLKMAAQMFGNKPSQQPPAANQNQAP
jgi:hypothetical protein